MAAAGLLDGDSDETDSLSPVSSALLASRSGGSEGSPPPRSCPDVPTQKRDSSSLRHVQHSQPAPGLAMWARGTPCNGLGGSSPPPPSLSLLPLPPPLSVDANHVSE